jgi:hypothetical protein
MYAAVARGTSEIPDLAIQMRAFRRRVSHF